jgi:PAS domain S-box-containing protein
MRRTLRSPPIAKLDDVTTAERKESVPTGTIRGRGLVTPRSLLTHRERLVHHVGAMSYSLQDVDLWLVDSLMIPASVHDAEGRFLHMNEAAERAIGQSNAQLLGRHFTEPVPPEARENVAAQFRRAVERGEPTDFETVFVDASGQLRGVRAQHLPLRSGDAIVGVLILAFGTRRPPSGLIGLEPQPQLTPRQHEILGLIASGLSTAEIATQLTISPETVRNHLRSIFSELQVHTRLEAMAAAQRLGLLAPQALGPEPPDPSTQTG